MIELENRVDRLEDAIMRSQMMLQGLSIEVNKTQAMVNKLSQESDKTQGMVQGLSKEMNEFKTHTQAGMDNLNNALEQSNNEQNKKFDKLTKELNQKFEKLTKMMGTMVEDIVIPNVDFIAEKYFNLKYGRILPRAKGIDNKDPKYNKEFDTLAVYQDKVIWVSAKLTAKPEYAKEFYEEVRDKELFKYFPDYESKEIIPIFASFHIPENVLIYLTDHKIYAMASKEDTMDILNFEDVK
jgi:hypothetical protein